MTLQASNSPDAGAGIRGMFLQSVSASPDRIAVQTRDVRYTYAELDQVSGRIAGHLHRILGDVPRPVALMLEDGAELLAALLGVLRAGHFYSILSSKNPPARLHEILNDLVAPALIVSRPDEVRSSGILPAGCQVVGFLDAQQSNDPEHFGEQPGDPYAAVYYTSGSTAEPKGVLRSHRLIVQRALMEVQRQGINAGDRILLCYAMSSAASVSTIFSALFGGASLYIHDAASGGINALRDLIQKEQITYLRIPVELLRHFLDSLSPGDFFPSIRVIGSAGDVLYFGDLERLRPHVQGQTWFVTQLGISEIGSVTMNRVRMDQPFGDGIVPVGLPVPGKEILILGEDLKPVRQGEIGEICVRTQVQFAGYWNRPGLTSAKTMPDPEDPARTMYRTGDLGRLLPDGQVEFAGRVDQRVKIRGYSVDLNAVETVLMSLDNVRRGIVVAPQDLGGKRRLVAYVMPAPGSRLSARGLRHALAARLPAFMMPSHFSILNELPLTRTGKVDRLALPDPRWSQPERTTPYVAPRDELEDRILAIWRMHLRVDEIGVYDDFLELGGDSLMAASLMVSLEKAFSRTLPVAMMLKASTVAQQAEFLRREGLDEAEPVLIPIRGGARQPPLICFGGRGGTPIRFNRLLGYLDPQRPVYYFRSRGLKPAERVGQSVEEVASDFLRDLRAIQPRGPYYFLGESSGGLIAYEIAQQLRAEGATVAFLGLLDTYVSGDRKTKNSVLIVLKKHLQTVASGGAAGLRVYLAYYLGLSRYKLYQLRTAGRRLWMNIRHRGVYDKYARVARAATLANRVYTPAPYAGTVHLFRAMAQARFEDNDARVGWGRVGIDDLVIHPIDCYHGNMLFEPFVAEVAAILNKHLVSEPPAVAEQITAVSA